MREPDMHRPEMNPASFYRRIPLQPHQLTERLTPTKDLIVLCHLGVPPVARVDADVLLAYELNAAPLPIEHGFPVRLVVPGFYGTNSVKWLSGITLAATRPSGPFTTRYYNDPVLDAARNDTGRTQPVWAI